MSDISTQQSKEYCIDVSRLAVELHPEWHENSHYETIERLKEIINYDAVHQDSHDLMSVEPLWTSIRSALSDWRSVRIDRHLDGPLPFVSLTLMRVARPLSQVLVAISSFESRDDIVSLIREAQRNAYQVKQMLEEAWDVSKEARKEAP